MATIVSRRLLPPRPARASRLTSQPLDDTSFFVGLAYALPLGVFLWLSLGLAIDRLV